MQLMSKIAGRLGCALLAYILYVFLYLLYLMVHADFMSVLLFSFFGFTIALKGITVLSAVSLLLDELILNRILGRFSSTIRILLGLLIYAVLGMMIAWLCYGSNSLVMVSGLTVSMIYIVLLQQFFRISSAPEGGDID
ncbi:hypothetical protein [Paenibacillus chibensis]|uniref:hypothetical protein n=1 Tax=Paenibacillus chibensis TaxID=59846 RepID=UPI000FD932EC|nr:hypothetical protein [Paenibacillus chibensis]MEC0368638.1 hypothetical protein [Paenibacillus chibensis]